MSLADMTHSLLRRAILLVILPPMFLVSVVLGAAGGLLGAAEQFGAAAVRAWRGPSLRVIGHLTSCPAEDDTGRTIPPFTYYRWLRSKRSPGGRARVPGFKDFDFRSATGFKRLRMATYNPRPE